MRDFKSMKRQRSRNRGSGKPQHNANRAFDSNGPDGVKIRGNAQHVFEKYQQLARDATASGDRVLAENYLQHAEHYFRVLRAVQPQRPASEIIGRDAFTSGIDIDFEDESGGEGMEAEAGETQSEDGGDGRQGDRQEPRGENGRQDYRGEYRNNNNDRRPDDRRPDDRRPDDRRPDYRRDEYRQDRPEPRRDDRPEARPESRSDSRPEGRSDARPEGRQDRDRYEKRPDDRGYNRDDRPAGNRDDRPAGNRDDRPAANRDRPYRDDRPPRNEGRDRYEGRPPREGADPLPVIEPEATPLPRAAAEETSSRKLRSQDGDFSPAPAFLQPRVESTGGDEPEAAPEPKRRRTRAPRPAADPAPADES